MQCKSLRLTRTPIYYSMTIRKKHRSMSVYFWMFFGKQMEYQQKKLSYTETLSKVSTTSKYLIASSELINCQRTFTQQKEGFKTQHLNSSNIYRIQHHELLSNFTSSALITRFKLHLMLAEPLFITYVGFHLLANIAAEVYYAESE